MRDRETALAVLEALRECGEGAGDGLHGWVLDSKLLPAQRHGVNTLAGRGLVELGGREVRAELSAMEGRPVRWAARLTAYGHDTLAYARTRPQPASGPSRAGEGQRLIELLPSQLAVLRTFLSLDGELRVQPAAGLAEQVRTASCDHTVKRWRLHLTEDQIKSVAYAFWLHRIAGSAAEANRFGREYGVIHQLRAEDPAVPGLPGAVCGVTM
ncbi:DUF6417 family protein (plasmid) [Streptomyces sp. NBC_01450]|uniref:DUF6417 family protein n=1 Tax=Streptomyces sp. NBC_01450 TaxID=2903871 RepID=UPI002E35D953|nr:DUF6417 family protein [Streptomyces sp. NBC_01450]